MNYNDAEYECNVLDFYKKVGLNVKKARKEKNITQMQLANLLNFKSVSSIANAEICYDKHHFSLSQLYRISLVLNIDIKQLVDTDF